MWRSFPQAFLFLPPQIPEEMNRCRNSYMEQALLPRSVEDLTSDEARPGGCRSLLQDSLDALLKEAKDKFKGYDSCPTPEHAELACRKVGAPSFLWFTWRWKKTESKNQRTPLLNLWFFFPDFVSSSCLSCPPLPSLNPVYQNSCLLAHPRKISFFPSLCWTLCQKDISLTRAHIQTQHYPRTFSTFFLFWVGPVCIYLFFQFKVTRRSSVFFFFFYDGGGEQLTWLNTKQADSYICKYKLT